ncbi:ABC transporter ATP-binding protein [Dactylosporangium aurantiacum]|uniref:ABC transporter ATP-binding protein n=1 Tax=Dactylosporangium aurantiacum TaxID=35754 RepID=A0A9Q9IBC1_9ACTN|nr:ABC transporter ATP-binding protein [Dactylosporangium aurantiacum]MDG6107289.1 ABC transporter ATP-binding protein [Dactylosporangium aurantiacum]UWZ51183.1 ABC transporter ATP-binding protein [Dactylosporangium aurantiacum]
MTRAGWRLLWSLLRRRPRPLLAVAGLVVVLAAPTTLTGIAVAHALEDGFFAHRAGTGLLWVCLLVQVRLLGTVAGRLLFPPLVRVVEPLRDELVTAVVTAGLRRAVQQDARVPGTAVRQAVDEVEQARMLVASVLRNAHATGSVAVGAVIGLGLLDPAILLVELPCLAAAAVGYRLLVRAVLRRQRRCLLAEEDLADHVAAAFAARRDVAAFAAHDAAAAPVLERVERARVAARDLRRADAIHVGVVGVGVDLGLILLLVLAPVLIGRGRLGTGDLVAAVYYVMFALGPALRFLVYGGADWLAELLGLMTRLSDAVTGAPPPARTGPSPAGRRPAVVAESVGYAYAKDAAPVLDDVDFTVPFGTHVAVVGPSGAGKSTLAALLCGVRRPDRGTVRIGGAPPAPGSATLVLAPQEPYVFAGTVRENLAYLAPAAADATLRRAADAFGLHRLGLDQRLGAGGAGLSAGERQLLTLARTYLSAAAVVVLDEATSHLDPDAEHRAELLMRRRGGTLIVIAHRISSAARADRVLLVDEGGVVAAPHHELLDRSPRYRQLVGLWEPAAEGVPHERR